MGALAILRDRLSVDCAGRSTTLPWGDETFAIMGTRSIQEIVAEVGPLRQPPAPAAKPAPNGIQLTAHAAAA